MNKAQLEHILLSASTIGDDNEIIVIGSQSVLGQFPDAGQNLVLSHSMEADIYLKNKLENTLLVEAVIGEGSLFHHTFGYYAQEVGPNTAILPTGWEDRLSPVVVKRDGRIVTGYCLEVHDLAVAKYAAGREKDLIFIAVMINRGMLRKRELIQRVHSTKRIHQPHAVIEKIKANFKEYASRHHDFERLLPSLPPYARPTSGQYDQNKQAFLSRLKKLKS